MKTLVLLMVFGCVTVNAETQQQQQTPASLPFNVVCKSDHSANLTLIGSDKIIAGKGKCDPKDPSAKGIYTLGQDCLTNDGTFIVGTKLTVGNKNVVKTGTGYKVSCTNRKTPEILTVASQKLTVDTNGTPVPESFTVKAPHIFMSLVKDEPGTTEITESSITTATLGTTIYLTIVDISGKLKMIPVSCEAHSGSSTATIWKNDNGKCTFEDSIVTQEFEYKDANSQHLMYAEIKAFRFVDAPQEDITFTCRVKECAETNSNPDCPTEGPSTCTAGHITAKRRRRELTNSKVDEATLHHLTARLRISDHFAVHGGSGSVHYALSGVLLSVLIQIIL